MRSLEALSVVLCVLGVCCMTAQAAGPDMEMVAVKGGCYRMGDTFGDGRKDERPVHEVCVDDFFIGKFEVTQGQWKALMGTNPSEHATCGDGCPVERVSWNEVQEFIGRLNRITGKNYGLPTESEWEYASRSGGKTEKWAGTSDEQALGQFAWYEKNAGSVEHRVGLKRPNGLGIHDMSGNVWEWVNDWYGDDYYKNSPGKNPQGPPRGRYKVLRGGSAYFSPPNIRASYRNSNLPSYRDPSVGFRLALSAQ